MSIPVTCGSCGKSFNLKDQNAGKRLKCSGCGGAIDVPDVPANAPSPAPQPAARPPQQRNPGAAPGSGRPPQAGQQGSPQQRPGQQNPAARQNPAGPGRPAGRPGAAPGMAGGQPRQGAYQQPQGPYDDLFGPPGGFAANDPLGGGNFGQNPYGGAPPGFAPAPYPQAGQGQKAGAPWKAILTVLGVCVSLAISGSLMYFKFKRRVDRVSDVITKASSDEQATSSGGNPAIGSSSQPSGAAGLPTGSPGSAVAQSKLPPPWIDHFVSANEMDPGIINSGGFSVIKESSNVPWAPDATVIAGFGPESVFDKYSVRLPRGFESVSPVTRSQGTGRISLFAWQAKELDAVLNASLIEGFELPPGETLSKILPTLFKKIRMDGDPEGGQIGGRKFVRARYQTKIGEKVQHGTMYVTFDGERVIVFWSGTAVEPGKPTYELMENACLSFKSR